VRQINCFWPFFLQYQNYHVTIPRTGLECVPMNNLTIDELKPITDWDALYKKSGNVKCVQCSVWLAPRFQKDDGLCPYCTEPKRRGDVC